MREYIYYLVDPFDHQVRYVGKTKHPEQRYRQHIDKLDKSMTPKRRWLESLFARNAVPEIVIAEVVDESIARDREQYHVTLNRATAYNIHNPAKGAKSYEMYSKKNRERDANDH